MSQAETDSFCPVPHKGIEIVPDGMVLVFIRYNPDGVINLFLIGKPIGFFQIKGSVLLSRYQTKNFAG